MKRILNNFGFVLVELLIVMAVIGVLAAGLINIINPVAQLQRAHDTQRKNDLNQIKKALEAYYQDNGRYPVAVNFMIESTGDDRGAAIWGTNQWAPYMSTLPKDPSSPRKNYIYGSTSDGQTYCIYASLDREVQLTSFGSCYPSEASCGAGVTCNYGISSPNVSP